MECGGNSMLVRKQRLRKVASALVMALLIHPVAVQACLPPPLVEPPPQAPGQSDESYYDSLVAMSYPNGWEVVGTPPQLPGESADTFQARIAAFNEGMRLARERRTAAWLAQLSAEEAQRWDEAPQVLLVEARGTRRVRADHTEWDQTRFTVIRRLRGSERHRTFSLRYPAFTTSCGPYYPSYSEGQRMLIFANPGPVSAGSLIATYGNENARDNRTRELLGLEPLSP